MLMAFPWQLLEEPELGLPPSGDFFFFFFD